MKIFSSASRARRRAQTKMSILLATREPHGSKLFYKSNQARLSAYNKQRSKDLINQLKQKERINALNQEQVYNDEVADQLAQLYAKFVETNSYKKTKLLPPTTMDTFTQIENGTNPLALPPSSRFQMLGAPSPDTPILEAPPSPPPIEAKKSRSAPSSLTGSPLVSELKGVLNVDPEEKKKIDSMTVAELKNYLDSIKVEYAKSGLKKQDFRNLAYSKLPKVKLEGKGIRIKRRRHLRK